jgi:hypothetical protein
MKSSSGITNDIRERKRRIYKSQEKLKRFMIATPEYERLQIILIREKLILKKIKMAIPSHNFYLKYFD